MKAVFVIPWYGPDIPGGAEAECRRTAENLVQRGTEVEVLTTCLKSLEAGWDRDHHQPGTVEINGVPVTRFPVDLPRNAALFNQLNDRLIRGEELSPGEEKAFFENMVNSRALYDRIAAMNRARDCIFFPIPYLFSTTINTIEAAPESTIPIACLHDEGYAYMETMRRAFLKSRSVLFHTRAEFELAQNIMNFPEDKALPYGEGIDTGIKGDGDRFRLKYKITAPFMLYAGRRDKTKNVPLLIELFCAHKRAHGGDLKLALMGALPLDIPAGFEEEIIDLGFLPVEDKADALAAASIFCQPSVNESFSIVIMEAWLCGTPVLVHADCPATVEHVTNCQGGFTFRSLDDFSTAVENILANPDRAATMAASGRKYVLDNFHWDVICRRYQSILEPPPPVKKVQKSGAKIKKPAVHQIVSHLAFGDAVGNEVLLIRDRFKAAGVKSQIYADVIDRRIRRQARSLDRFIEEAGPDDLILWHFSTGSRVVDWLRDVSQTKIMRYHNVTPDGFFRGINPAAALNSRRGRHQLHQAAAMCALGIGVSNFNRHELDAAGFAKTAVAPFVFKVEDFKPGQPGPVGRRHAQGGPNVLHVGRLTPQKRIEALIKAFYFFKKVHPEARLFLVGGSAGFEGYVEALEALVSDLDLTEVHFCGRVGSADLVDYYNLADLYLCLSEHEGFCVPLVEAMAADLPVIARSAAAVPETLGGAGILLDDPGPAQAAEAMTACLAEDVRASLLAGQRKRLAELKPEKAWDMLWSLLTPYLSPDRGGSA